MKAGSAVQRAVSPPEPAAGSQGVQARARESIPAALPLKPVMPPESDRESPAGMAGAQAQKHLGRMQKHLGRVLSGDSLLRLDRPSVGTTWAEHRKAAAQWEVALARYPRLLYGLAHTGVTALVYVLLWATSTPPGLVITAALLAAFAYWS